jgi:hypothetical protein
MFSSRAGARPLTPALSPDAGGEGAFLPLPLAGEGWGEGYSVTTSAVLNFIANQEGSCSRLAGLRAARRVHH